MKGYKATDYDMTCRRFQFELNKEFKIDGQIKICRRGFHFCNELKDVFNYYSFSPSVRLFEVEIPDDAILILDHIKSVTNRITFVRELTDADISELTNGLYKREHKNGLDIFHEHTIVSYFQNGLRHREDGPAIIHDDYEFYYQNGKLHRENGPAIIYKNNKYLPIDHMNNKDAPGKNAEYWVKGEFIGNYTELLYT